MKCLRCNTEMKYYPISINFGAYGTPKKTHPFSNATGITHNPHSVFVCDNCGYDISIIFNRRDIATIVH